jgi:hypothetical protein
MYRCLINKDIKKCVKLVISKELVPNVKKERIFFIFMGQWSLKKGPQVLDGKGDTFVRNVVNY